MTSVHIFVSFNVSNHHQSSYDVMLEHINGYVVCVSLLYEYELVDLCECVCVCVWCVVCVCVVCGV